MTKVLVLEILHAQQPEADQHTLWIALEGGRLIGEDDAADEIVAGLRKRARWMGLISEDTTDVELIDVIAGWSNGYTAIRRI